MKRRKIRQCAKILHLAALCGFLSVVEVTAIEQQPQSSQVSAENQGTATNPAGAPASTASPAAKEERIPRGLDKIVEMTKSGVGTETVVAFVEATPVAYKLTADQILLLHKNGVPSEVISALIRHGSEVRAQMREESIARQTQPTQQTEPAQIAPNYSPAPTYYAPAQPVYAAPQYAYPPYSYAYSYSYPSYGSGFLLIGTSHFASNYRCSPSYFSYPRYCPPVTHGSRPVHCAVGGPTVAAGFFRDSFHFRH